MTSALDVWLGLGKKVQVGGKEFVLMPLPLSRLRKIGDWLQNATLDEVKDVVREAKATSDPWKSVAAILKRIDIHDVVFHLFADPKDTEGTQVNPEITKEFLEEYLDTPTVRRIFKAFIEVNELEETIKNLSDLPGARRLMEALTITFGLPFLNSLQQSMGFDPNRSESSPVPRSTDISRDAITESLESGPKKPQPIQ